MNQNTLHSTGEVNHLQIVLMGEELNHGSGLLYHALLEENIARLAMNERVGDNATAYYLSWNTSISNQFIMKETTLVKLTYVLEDSVYILLDLILYTFKIWFI